MSGTASTPHNDDDGIIQHPHSQNQMYMCIHCFPEHPGCGVLVRVWRMWVRVVPIPPARYTYFICRRDVMKL